MSNEELQTSQGLGYRIRSVLNFIPFVSLLFSMYMVTGKSLRGADAQQLEGTMLFTLVFVSILILVSAVPYLIFGSPSLLRLLGFMWRTVLSSTFRVSIPFPMAMDVWSG